MPHAANFVLAAGACGWAGLGTHNPSVAFDSEDKQGGRGYI
jgi:hypothetical protein